MWMINCLISKSPLKYLVDIGNSICRVIENYKNQTEIQYDDKERILSILNKAKNSILDFYLTIKLFVS